MTREKSIKIRLTEQAFGQISLDAKSKVFSGSVVIRGYIKRLAKMDSLRSIHLPLNLKIVTGVKKAPFMIERSEWPLP